MKLTKTVRLVAVGAVAASAATLMGGGVASAATVGGLTINPSTDTTTTNTSVSVTTAGLCPGTASKYVIKLLGPGGLSGNLAPITTLPAASAGTYANVPITQTIHDTLQAMAGAPASPSGTGWSIDFQCINVSTGQNVADYSSALTFSQPGSVGGSFDAAYTSAPASTPTTTTLSVPATSTYGGSVTFTATEATAGVTPGVAAGSVQFFDNGVALGSAVPVNGTTGQATYTSSTLNAGAHPITATFTPTDTTTYGGSSASAQTLTVAKAATSVSVTGPASAQAQQSTTFTATVPTGLAGSVAWTIDGASAGSSAVDTTSSTATVSHVFTTAENPSVVAVFTPSNSNYASSTSTAWTGTTVTAFQGVTAAQEIDVTVPAGGLTIAVSPNTEGNTGGSSANPVVQMGTPTFQPSGQFWLSTGQLNDVVITDTRSGNPGWTATGSVTDFSQVGVASNPETFSGANLGWTPTLVSASANQASTGAGDTNAIKIGAAVASGLVPTGATPGSTVTGYGTTGIGLSAPQAFASTSAGRGDGAATIKAPLVLNIPTDRAAGLYSAVLTFTVL
ncbi:MAG: Ig-like domain repeat protein [Bacillota bacterium]